jgi:dihydrodipicolinate synthase/N-acetylneuraminate lyase
MFPANLFFIQNNYVPAVKTAANMAGFNVGPCRKPLMPLSKDKIAELRSVLASLGQ